MFIARFARSCYRIPGFLFYSLYKSIRLAWAVKRNRHQPEVAHSELLKYIRGVHRLMGIHVTVQGELPDEPSVFMGNHRSYVDAVLIPSRYPVTYVARSESQHWPIIGWGASLLGTIWVNRKDPDSRKATRESVKERLQQGNGIIIFPEGTTHKGPDLLPYRPSMFYICAEGGFPITPVAIEYRDPDIAWVGKEWFIPHAWKHFGKRRIEVAVTFGETKRFSEGGEAQREVHAWTSKTVARLRAAYDRSLPS